MLLVKKNIVDAVHAAPSCEGVRREIAELYAYHLVNDRREPVELMLRIAAAIRHDGGRWRRRDVNAITDPIGTYR